MKAVRKPQSVSFVHCTHSVNCCKRTERHASLQGGGAAACGALSTLLATLFLASARSYVIVTLFHTLLLIVLCGAFQGLVVLPVLLGMLPGAKRPQASRGNRSVEDGAGDDAATQSACGAATRITSKGLEMRKHGCTQGGIDSQGSSVSIAAGHLDADQAEQDLLGEDCCSPPSTLALGPACV